MDGAIAWNSGDLDSIPPNFLCVLSLGLFNLKIDQTFPSSSILWLDLSLGLNKMSHLKLYMGFP